MNEPEVLSKYMLKVTVNEESWKNFLYFSGMAIIPAKEIASAGDPADERGKAYLDEYNFKFTSSCGAYEVREEDINTGKSISIRRRSDWWGKDNPAFTGLYNIGEYRFIVVKDYNLAFEKLKKGEIDYYVVPKAEWWAVQIPELEQVKRGLIVPHKVFNDSPVGTSGMAINMNKPGLDDVRVRKALNHLNNRKMKIEKLYYNEYVPLSSYYQGGLYQNPNNELLEFDLEKAVNLLVEAGWSELDGEGYRKKDGRQLRFTLTYRSKSSERGLTIYQEDCRKAGIKIDLQLLTPASGWKNLRAKEFELMSTAWGALVFPNPETSYHSRYATEPDNNNVTGFANARVDELCTEYDQCYDIERRTEIIKEVDGIVYNEYPYVLEHFGPSQRVAFWNRFSMPDFGAQRFVDAEELMYTWWVDPAKDAALAAAKEDSSITLETIPTENRFWQQWNAAQRAR
jgi:ABC-type transport system substrate-binding protein